MVAIARRALLGPTLCLAIVGPLLHGGAARAQEEILVPSPSNYGGVGLIDTRTARFLPDGYFSFTGSFAEPDDRYALTFQGLPWAEFTFRYSIDHAFPAGGIPLHDRSFDVKLRLSHEGEYIPEIALGMQDILGTGVYAGEYLVGSKRWGPFDVSLGVGWGRLASRGTFKNPFLIFGDRFGTRAVDAAQGGTPLLSSYFRGPDMGVFGGISYRTPWEGVTLKAEYSSDSYKTEKFLTGRDYGFPLNLGVSYRPFPWLDLGLSWVHGHEVGFRVSTLLDAEADIWPVKLDQPPRFRARSAEAATLLSREPVAATVPGAPNVETHFIDLTQTEALPPSGNPPQPETPPLSAAVPQVVIAAEAAPATATPESLPPGDLPPELHDRIKAAIEEQVLVVASLERSGRTVKLVILNGHYLRDVEAIARTARVLSAEAPAEIEFFEITIMRAGLPLTTVTLPRTAIDNIARRAGSSAELFVGSTLEPAGNDKVAKLDVNLFPRFGWDAYPIFRQSFFDPDHPVYIELGAGFSAYVELARGLFIEGSTAISLYDDYDQIRRSSNSVLPHVRSDIREYLQQGRYGVESLAASYYFKLRPELYGRVTGGYIERMFAGVGTEFLYRPFMRRWALGFDFWAVQQRGFDVQFRLRPYQAYTGHVTAYYASPWHDVLFAVSAGQYLAGDRGFTFEVSRRFSTGVIVGAWFTLTNVPAERFGEGSFDKGIRIIIPFEWAAPFRTQQGYGLDLRPIQRDGGQRLTGDSLLYGLTDSSDYGAMSQQWNSVFGR